MTWKPAVEFGKCYLSVYKDKKHFVYMTKETYALLGKPKRIMVFPIGRTIAFSPAKKHGAEVMFNVNGQPFVVHQEASAAIGTGGRAYYAYDEEDYDEDWNKRRYFYFRVSSSAPATPRARPKNQATR